MSFAPPLAQGAPVAQGTEFKDSSPHFEHLDALTAIVGTIVSQLLSAGAPFTDTLGPFRPVVITDTGITVNTSLAHPTTLKFHDTSTATTDVVVTSGGPGILQVEPNTNASSIGGIIVSGTSAPLPAQQTYFAALANVGIVTLSVTQAVGGGTIWDRTHIVRVKAGAPVDSDYVTPTDGMVVVDSTNNRIYARHGGAWHYAALT